MNNLLILGAGVYQLPLIKVAKAQGYRTVVVSIPGNYPGIKLCDEFYPINTTDSLAVKELARRICPAGIVTAGTDVALFSLAMSCAALGLPGPTPDSARMATNKRAMKDAFLAGGVRSARYMEVRSTAEAMRIWDTFGAPVLFKCVDKSGSRGIAKAFDRCEAEAACKYAFSASDLDYVLAELLIEGHEIGVDGYVDLNGNVVFMAPHDKVVWNNGKTDIPIGHKMNGAFIDFCYTKTDLKDQVQRVASSLKMSSCFFNMDVMIADGKAWIIEAGVRTGATCIPEVISAYYGFDMYEAILMAAVGDEPYFSTNPRVAASEGRLLFAKEESVLVNPIDLSARGISVSYDYPVGSELPSFVSGNNRCGQMVATGSSPELLSQVLDSASSNISEKCFLPKRLLRPNKMSKAVEEP